MKCPVCKHEQENNNATCCNCGFDQLSRNFVSAADAEQWMNNTVHPCRSIWIHTQSLCEKANEEKEKYRALYIQTLQEHVELLEDHKNLLELQSKRFTPIVVRDPDSGKESWWNLGDEINEDEELPF